MALSVLDLAQRKVCTSVLCLQALIGAWGYSEPPRVDLSQDGVRHLVAHIEEGMNAEHLKYRVFVSRHRLPYTREWVLTLIDEELGGLGASAGSSRRWFLLMSVKAVAASRVRFPSRIPELEYLAIFEKAKALSEFPELMNRILTDFIMAACWTSADRPRMSRDSVEKALKMTIPFWLAADQAFAVEADLSQLVSHYRLHDLCERQITAMAESGERSFAFNRRVGLYYAKRNPKKALPYLAKAEKMAGLQDLPALCRRRFFRALVAACRKTDSLAQAIAYQRRAVETCGGSRAVLAELYHAAKQHEQRDAVIAEALSDRDRREDIPRVASVLSAIGKDEKAIETLEAFLRESPAPDEPRLQATIELVTLYMAHDKRGSAKQVLEGIDASDYPPTLACRKGLAQIAGLRKKLGDGDQ